MDSKLKTVLYAASVFVVFMILTWLLRLVSGKLPIEGGMWGIYKNSDFFLGIVVMFIVTLSHIQKRKLKK